MKYRMKNISIKAPRIAELTDYDLKNKLDKFTDSLKNYLKGDLLKLIEENCFIAGGCFTSLYYSEQPNDYDFFFKNQEAIDKFYNIINDGMKNGIAFTDTNFLKLKSYQVNKTENAVTFTFDLIIKKVNIQFITFRANSILETLTGFDFYHSKIAYDLKDKYLYEYQDEENYAYSALTSKKLIFDLNATHPLNSIKRVAKFSKIGFQIYGNEIIKLAQAIRMLDFNNENTLNEQTRGLVLYGEIKSPKTYLDTVVKPKLKKIHEKLFKNKFNDIIEK